MNCTDRRPPEGQQLRYCGVGAGFDDVIIVGNPDEMKVPPLALYDILNADGVLIAVHCILCEGRQGRSCCKVNVLRVLRDMHMVLKPMCRQYAKGPGG